jgi:hypothetical protein
MFIKYKYLLILLIISSCVDDQKDDRLVHLSSKLGPQFESIISKTDEQIIIFLGDKACNGCVDIAIEKIYQANLKYSLTNVSIIFPDYYLKNINNQPKNIFIDSTSIVNTTSFLTYLTVIKVSNYKVNEIKHLDYSSADSLVSAFISK